MHILGFVVAFVYALITTYFIASTVGSELEVQSEENVVPDCHESLFLLETKKVIWDAKKRIRPGEI